MTANPTDKPKLPDNPKDIPEFNLTLPISTSQQLIHTARLLRTQYYFNKIPDSWIKIDQDNTQLSSIIDTDTNDTNNKKPTIPTTLVELQEKLELIQDEILITLPITQQQDITPILTILKQHFDVTIIPTYLLQLPPLPAPTWDIFN